MNSIAELVAAYQADKLKLPALFDALSARGAVSAPEHQADIDWLEQQRVDDTLDTLIIRALLAKLAAVQTQAGSPPDDPDDADVTWSSPRRSDRRFRRMTTM